LLIFEKIREINEIKIDKLEKRNNQKGESYENNFCFPSNENDDLKDNQRKKCNIL